MIQLTLDKALKARQWTRYKLAKSTGIQYHIIDKYYKNTVTRYDSYVLDRICEVLECDITDIVEYRNNNTPSN